LLWVGEEDTAEGGGINSERLTKIAHNGLVNSNANFMSTELILKKLTINFCKNGLSFVFLAVSAMLCCCVIEAER
jgi:hypothetical protein